MTHPVGPTIHRSGSCADRIPHMEWLTHSQSGFQQAARYLLGMRLAIIALQLTVLAVTEALLSLVHQTEALILCLAYAVLSALCWLWFSRRPPGSKVTVSLVLTGDLLLIGTWLYFTGGYTNPLVSLLLLPIAVALILVPLRYSAAITAAGVAIYTLLMVWHQPVSTGDSTTDLAQLHLVGMWVAFAITAAILLMVLGTLSRRLRQKQQQLSSIRETRLRDEQIIALGLSAAAVAHRLGTPLNTMTLLVDEMKSVMPEGEQVADDLALMENQLTLCKEHLQQLSEAATHARTTRPEVLAAGQWLRRIRESATLLWPGANLEWQEPFPECPVAVDATLDQAILNLLANAIAVSPDWVSVGAQHGSADQLEIIVEDHGDGLDSSLSSTLGEQVVTSENGLGVGLFLSNATIQRLGGVLKARVSSEGTTMMIELPVASVEQPG